jgi:hypothetical protein
VRTPTDRQLPPDHDAFLAAEPPTGRVIVIAPTRAACETIEIALGLRLETYLDVVGRGRRGALRADTLLELQELLDMPWMPDELEVVREESGGGRMGRGRGARRPRR